MKLGVLGLYDSWALLGRTLGCAYHPGSCTEPSSQVVGILWLELRHLLLHPSPLKSLEMEVTSHCCPNTQGMAPHSWTPSVTFQLLVWRRVWASAFTPFLQAVGVLGEGGVGKQQSREASSAARSSSGLALCHKDQWLTMTQGLGPLLHRRTGPPTQPGRLEASKPQCLHL